MIRRWLKIKRERKRLKYCEKEVKGKERGGGGYRDDEDLRIKSEM